MEVFSDFDGHFFDSDHPPFSGDAAPAHDDYHHFPAPFNDHLGLRSPDTDQGWGADATSGSLHLESAQASPCLPSSAAGGLCSLPS